MNEANKESLRVANIGRVKGIEELRKLGTPVYQIDKNTNEIIQRWDTMSEAARALNIKSANLISQACDGKNRSAGGFKWKRASKNTLP